MRLRLVHKLSLLLMGVVLVSVIAMASVVALNLNEGFTDYLVARDVSRLNNFVEFAEDFIEEQNSAGIQSWKSPGMKPLMDGYALELGLPGASLQIAGSRPPGSDDSIVSGKTRQAGFAEFDSKAEASDQRPRAGHKRGRRHKKNHFALRLRILDADGKTLFMNSFRPENPAAYLVRPLHSGTDVVGYVRLYTDAHVPDDVGARFLAQQYKGIALISILLVVLALFSSWCMARHWVRPLLEIQKATARLAKGNFDVRVPVDRREQSRDDEIGDLVNNINRMAEGLGRLERSRRRWLADISHELRTPLAVLRGEIEALVDGVRPVTSSSINSLKEEAVHLSSLVDDVHLLALSDLRALPCEFAELDVVGVLKDLLKRFEARATAGNITLSFEHNELSSLSAVWDKSRIQQLLDNMVENSLRYTDAPGRIVISLQQMEQGIVICVDDTAPAPGQASLPLLFEPLYRSENTNGHSLQSSGLGLAISEAIARSHSGTLDARLSSLGGLQICVTLPQVVIED